ncbi:MAG TPA: hypothetical protein PKK10_05430 [Woeseiaceae bacterium]|nr:hypothetical protein [Woeseiaceae bacterium]
MGKILFGMAVITAAIVLTLGVWRWSDKQADKTVWNTLALQQPKSVLAFDESMITGLPEPAQRYFRYAIQPGAPLYTVAEIAMEGEFSLGNKAEPNYMSMRAQEIIAAPQGFVWTVRTGTAGSIAGSDGAKDGTSWSRFWLYGLVPVARAGNNRDHARAAFGRYVAEAIFWTPAALLPTEHVHWEWVNSSTARVTMLHMSLDQAVDLTVDSDGRLTKVKLQRWSNANASKKYQWQAFGGYLSDYKEFGGFRLPTRIDAGNFFETDDYFPFFKVTVTSVTFPQSGTG